jgi:uncharacterized sporulation protein YeaH/YhbH (DUF444 family)
MNTIEKTRNNLKEAREQLYATADALKKAIQEHKNKGSRVPYRELEDSFEKLDRQLAAIATQIIALRIEQKRSPERPDESETNPIKDTLEIAKIAYRFGKIEIDGIKEELPLEDQTKIERDILDDQLEYRNIYVDQEREPLTDSDIRYEAYLHNLFLWSEKDAQGLNYTPTWIPKYA